MLRKIRCVYPGLKTELGHTKTTVHVQQLPYSNVQRDIRTAFSISSCVVTDVRLCLINTMNNQSGEYGHTGHTKNLDTFLVFEYFVFSAFHKVIPLKPSEQISCAIYKYHYFPYVS